MNSKGSDFIGAFFMSDDFLILSSCLSAWFYMDYPCEKNNFLVKHAQLLKDSYRHLLLKDLIQNTDSDEAFARQLFHAPFAVVSHDTASDPVFNYANLKALELFELNWEDFTRLPSRLSAEQVNQEERERLLAEVTQKGYINHYEGVRISSTGKRFMIKNAVVWNLIDGEGCYKGQAAWFGEWAFL
jgi:hypothetical protein